ncbi:hypothetical protein DQ237_12175 [Blastococcus sp. TF02-8]|uniref:type II toxin-antitoxin system RatA family toxin n=1 Tax=Blastococcus sp. TF02-8 TaxID=2250574 RepID=UPI000DE84326|nr:SRPBCC family protein [Blastococcus sp. TF02-8]RBY96042.1 hypothetical protein DQ237_12175 [Blastococcus sp. TF02-8]
MRTVFTALSVDRPASDVWSAVLDIGSYPSFMPEVQEVVLLPEGDGPRLSRWAVLLKGARLEWIEQDAIDHASMRVSFSQLEGDLAHFVGSWRVLPADRGCSVEFEVTFDIGIPLLATMLEPVAADALGDLSVSMLRSLGAEITYARRREPCVSQPR